MPDSFIPQMEPWFGEEEKQALGEYMDSGGFITEYKHTEHFETLIAKYTGAKHCVVVNNGTVSLTLAAIAAGIRSSNEVIVPNYTMIATPNSVKMIGAEPAFVDVEPETLCLDIKLVKKRISSKTRAIILVSANGRYPKAGIEAFETLAQEHGIILIEDAAQALGSYYPDGRHIGRVGCIGSFSFSAPKIISTGQGGCLITDDDELAARLRRLKDFGRARGGIDVHDTVGFNFKFTDLQACVGIEQMKKLSRRVARKKDIWLRYREGLRTVTAVKIFEHNVDHTVPWFIDCIVERRDELSLHLRERGIGTRTMYPPINSQQAYRLPGNYPVSERIGRHGLWLPSSNQLSDDQIATVCSAIRDFYAPNP